MGSQNALPFEQEQHMNNPQAQQQYMQQRHQMYEAMNQQAHMNSNSTDNNPQMTQQEQQQQQMAAAQLSMQNQHNFYGYPQAETQPLQSLQGQPGVQASMPSQMLPTQQEIMAAGIRMNQAQSEVFPNQNMSDPQNTGASGPPQYMDQKAKERWLQEQSSKTFSQEDTSNEGTFARLSTDSRQTSFLPSQFNPNVASTQQPVVQNEHLYSHPAQQAHQMQFHPTQQYAGGPQQQFQDPNAMIYAQQHAYMQQQHQVQMVVPAQIAPGPVQHQFMWRQSGHEVLIIGSFSNWQQRTPMERVPGSSHEFRLVQPLAPGEYEYKYIVDGQWRCADDQEKVRDLHGNLNNKIFIKAQALPDPQHLYQQMAQQNQQHYVSQQQQQQQQIYANQAAQQYQQQMPLAHQQEAQQRQHQAQQAPNRHYQQPQMHGHPQQQAQSSGQAPQAQGQHRQRHHQQAVSAHHQSTQNEAENTSQYGQDMPDTFDNIIEPALIPVHLQYNMFARDDLPLKNPNPEDRLLRCSEDTMAPDVLTKGLFSRVLEAPSHVVLNHANCWTERDPTLAPTSAVAAAGGTSEGTFAAAKLHQPDAVLMDNDERTSLLNENEQRSDKGMTAVSLTLRLNASKFATLTYYKPKMQPKAQTNVPQLAPRAFVEDY